VTVIDPPVASASDGASYVLQPPPRYKIAYMSASKQPGSLDAAERERRRWARELHDDTLQALGALRVLLASARRTADVELLHAALDRALAQLTDEIAKLRALITELRPVALDELGLSPALEVLAERVRVTQGLEVHARVELHGGRVAVGDDAQCRIDPDVETAVYRIVQESLSNAVKHAGAERIEVVVAEHHGGIQIEVRDNGRGFDANAPTTGFGLAGIRERVSLAGGDLEIVSSGQGTAVLAWLPSPTDAHDG
jgi:signal transduction histidine kinase